MTILSVKAQTTKVVSEILKSRTISAKDNKLFEHMFFKIYIISYVRSGGVESVGMVTFCSVWATVI